MERIRDFHDYALYKFTFTFTYIYTHIKRVGVISWAELIAELICDTMLNG